MFILLIYFFFFFNDTATTEIYTLSLHDALPILLCSALLAVAEGWLAVPAPNGSNSDEWDTFPIRRIFGESSRSEEHTSELQSRLHLVCRLLLEKKKKKQQDAD